MYHSALSHFVLGMLVRLDGKMMSIGADLSGHISSTGQSSGYIGRVLRHVGMVVDCHFGMV